jgi:hypothetical protein
MLWVRRSTRPPFRIDDVGEVAWDLPLVLSLGSFPIPGLFQTQVTTSAGRKMIELSISRGPTLKKTGCDFSILLAMPIPDFAVPRSH